MRILIRLLVVAGLIAIGIWAWTTFFPSPQKAVERRLVKLAQLASFGPDEGNIAKVANVERIGACFADNVEVMIDVPGMESHTFGRRDELTQAVMGARKSLTSIHAKFPDIHVEVAPDQQSAVANAALEATIGGQSELIVQELKFTFKKTDGDWLITRIDTVKALRH